MSKVIVESLVYHLSGRTYESRLVYEPGALGRPGLVMAPNWMGIGEGAERIAKEVAEKAMWCYSPTCMGSRCARPMRTKPAQR